MNDSIQVGEDTHMLDSIHMANDIKNLRNPRCFATR
jgi:hypothetical protein